MSRLTKESDGHQSRQNECTEDTFRLLHASAQQRSVPETSDTVFTCSQESVNPSCSMCATLPVYLEQRGYLGHRTFSAKT